LVKLLKVQKRGCHAPSEWKFVLVTSDACQSTNLRSTRREGTPLASSQAGPFQSPDCRPALFSSKGNDTYPLFSGK
jgi:hypothetical protein